MSDIVELLIAERDKIDAAIGVLQEARDTAVRTVRRSYHRRAKTEKPVRKRRSAASRKAQAAKMKAYWAAKKRKAKARKKSAAVPKKKPQLVKDAA